LVESFIRGGGGGPSFFERTNSMSTNTAATTPTGRRRQTKAARAERRETLRKIAIWKGILPPDEPVVKATTPAPAASPLVCEIALHPNGFTISVYEDARP
jgi:hypothetical protein